jgi:hypothetical protein
MIMICRPLLNTVILPPLDGTNEESKATKSENPFCLSDRIVQQEKQDSGTNR